MRKDIKKSSYYVWFLGAQEAKGFRGAEFVMPVINGLVEREREVEPYKVTLQTSHKGVKIIQNVPLAEPAKKSSSKTEVVKHFIPHQAITCVYQTEDIVACILLLYNPVTKCPLHVHVYRCDSVETAGLLSSQLQTLVHRPDNQRKLEEIEGRLRCRGRPRDSESCSGGSLSSGVSSQEKIASLYDSLAAELKEKLATGPILLPPRDYDTVHRQKGDLKNIESRRCLTTSVVGPLARGRHSPGSSGIGSDHAPSPDRDHPTYLDHGSSSDEDWGLEQFKSETQKNWGRSEQVSLPRARRAQNESIDSKVSPSGVSSGGSSSVSGPGSRRKGAPAREEASPGGRWRRPAEERQRSPSPDRPCVTGPGPGPGPNKISARDRFQDAKEKFLSLERTEQERVVHDRRKATQGPVTPVLRALPSRPRGPTPDRAHYPLDLERLEPKTSVEKAPPYREEYEPKNRPDRRDKPQEERSLRHRYASEPSYPREPAGRDKDKYDYRYGAESLDECAPVPDRQSRHYRDGSVPLERYRSPPRAESHTRRYHRGSYPEAGEEETVNKGYGPGHYHRRQAENEKKRRSMYESVEEERKRSSNELAKEFMKRAFPQDGRPEEVRPTHRQEEPARYRHSYVEPSSLDAGSHLARGPRLGIAALHPY